MISQTIRITTDERGVAYLTLTRAEKHNALSAEMIDDLTAATNELAHDKAVRVVVLTGEGASFCAGGDLGWMRVQFDATRDGRMVEARRLAMLFKTLNELPKPLIARVHGNAFGGGIGILSVCDMVIAASTARFGLTEVRLGIIPATISPYVVARIGETNARPLFLSGKIIDAWQAHATGLLSRVVADEALDEAVEAEVRHFLAASPQAAARAKALTRSVGRPVTDSMIDHVVEQLADAWETDEAKEGITAFFEKRQPNWRTG
ncbi:MULTISPECIES: crotonase/enoyl-CoA hydratase family protein [Rhizobium]|uniref:Crotonase/enoyl-CoA hydratase family protein n=1 Tax=Rhizobium tropici TaxID=398 RepID=A0A6P1C980_RHITR|nr:MULTISPECIES: crotonase/enoyl-CoA hydratase family protein [Rhizobium]AGB70421.1 enoyl-CoA hydratase [Rhizobium tropici CIAT 899]MBB4241368.1 methylglutaconyl-CoA hydratase [Rhizobium tropici]MBB5592892.1 methylglutaconyl-CoA hydratase [Rhizobium tropici]MBB6491934.1 methylglutaconyl-CoA hydratase [Rhizobium tropici]NEV13769.1 crotonase/enoyl-CoA hydratase family protein [Rhizobium tropici]